METCWLLQTKAFDDGNPERFEEILKKQKTSYSWIQVAPFEGGWNYVTKSGPKLCPKYEVYDPQPLIHALTNYFFYGTINGYKQCGSLFEEAAGSFKRRWCDFEKLKYSRYGVWYGHHLLNNFSDYAPTTTQEIYRNPDKYFFTAQEIFIRPDDNEKSFDGEVVDRDKLSEWYHDTYKYNGNLNIPCWAFPKQRISQEWRVIICRSKVIGGSQYRLNGSVELLGGVPDHVHSFTEQMAEIYSPEPIFCMDIAETPLGLKVVEIGSIHTCGLYDTDLEPLVWYINKELND